jgi:hypothetical protein
MILLFLTGKLLITIEQLSDLTVRKLSLFHELGFPYSVSPEMDFREWLHSRHIEQVLVNCRL